MMDEVFNSMEIFKKIEAMCDAYTSFRNSVANSRITTNIQTTNKYLNQAGKDYFLITKLNKDLTPTVTNKAFDCMENVLNIPSLDHIKKALETVREFCEITSQYEEEFKNKDNDEKKTR